MLQDFYGDICRGPRRLPAPAKPANLPQLTPADPAGLAYLNTVTSWLLSTHVQVSWCELAQLLERVDVLPQAAVQLLRGSTANPERRAPRTPVTRLLCVC